MSATAEVTEDVVCAILEEPEQIYEGTNGIQALDLVGRKVLGSGGQLLKHFTEDIEESIADADGDGRLQEFVMGLQRAKAHLLTATDYLLLNAKQEPQLLGAVCVDYLELVGLVGSAYVWLKIANVAVEKTRGDDSYGDKLTTGRFFLTKFLPKIDTLIQTI